MNLSQVSQGIPRHTFPLFLKRVLLRRSQPDQIMLIVAAVWRIWKSRNWAALEEGQQFLIPVLIRQMNQQVQEWLSVPRDPVVMAVMLPPAPESAAAAGQLTCMWDGAVRQGSHAAGGIILKDEGGEVVLAVGRLFDEVDDPLGAEILTLREAVL